jgi:hypothetical protein
LLGKIWLAAARFFGSRRLGVVRALVGLGWSGLERLSSLTSVLEKECVCY